MARILTNKHSINIANNIVEDVTNSSSQYYLYVGRPEPWSNSSGLPDDLAVRIPNTSVQQVELDVYSELLFGKRIGNTDCIHVVPRYDWVGNTVFSVYDQTDGELFTKNFYCVTDEYSVFLCIDNAGGKPSTIKPSLKTASGTFITGDGYTWKYLYSIESGANTRFTSQEFIPLTPNSDVTMSAVPGTIDILRIANTGENYQVFEAGFISGVPTSTMIRLPNTSSVLDNYYTLSSIYLKSGFGAGQVKEIQSYTGSSRIISLIEPLDTFLKLEFANSSFISGGNPGEIVEQIIDTLGYFRSFGVFNAGEGIVQSDTGVSGSVLSANSSALAASRFNKNINFALDLPARSLSDNGAIANNKVNITNASSLSIATIVTPGSGYQQNAVVIITSNTGNGATAEAVSNTSGKIESIVLSTSGNGYFFEPTVVVANPDSISFNSDSDVEGGDDEGANNTLALSNTSVFSPGDQVRYFVASGNTVIPGLQNNTVYFVQTSNSTVLSLTPGPDLSPGNRVQIEKGLDENGHFIQGVAATVRLFPGGLAVTNAVSNSSLNAEYSVGEYIRVGENANNNIRRVVTSNATTLIVDRIMNNTLLSANTFKISTAVTVASVNTNIANGEISNTNLSTIRLNVTNNSILGINFIVGERVEMVSEANTVLNAEGIVAFSNSSVLFLGGIIGTWEVNKNVRGASSEQKAKIVSIESSPNVTLKNPQGSFVLGQQVDFRTIGGANTGSANLVSIINLSNTSIEYEIGPTVKIAGDGFGAIAVARVNTAIGTANGISEVSMIAPGRDYTRATVTVLANNLFGEGAILNPVISPTKGHGADLREQLGSRYISLSTKFDTAEAESWYYPTESVFRTIGILKNPSFANVIFNTIQYDTFDLELDGSTTTWDPGEYVLQANTDACGIVVSGNNSTLRVTSAQGGFAIGDEVRGLTSGSTSNCISVSSIRFIEGEAIEQTSSGGIANVIVPVGNTIFVTDVSGPFEPGERLVGTSSDATCTLDSILSADGLRNLSSNFGQRFNQTARLSLVSNTGSFTNAEIITQDSTNASGLIISVNRDLDLVVNTVFGTFNIGDNITVSNTGANARCVFANSSYLKLTTVSNADLFDSGYQIENGLSSTALIQDVRPVLIVTSVSSSNNFLPGSNIIRGSNSSAEGRIGIATKPDLIKNSGDVLYLESTDTTIDRTINSTQEIRIVIKI